MRAEPAQHIDQGVHVVGAEDAGEVAPGEAHLLGPGPEGLEALIRRCLQKMPADRFDDMDTLAAALAATLGATTDTMSTTSLNSN